MTGTLLPDGTRLQPGEEIFKIEIRFPDATGGRGTLALADGNMLMATKLEVGPLTSTRPQFPAPTRDGKAVYGNTPVPDVGMGEDKQFCTIHSLCRANNIDTGFALDAIRDGRITPDAKHYGNACWEAGDSANTASTKLAIAHAAHLAVSEVKQNRKPVVYPNNRTLDKTWNAK